MGGLSVIAARGQSFGVAIASTVAQTIGRPEGEVTLLSLTAGTITIAPLSVQLHSTAAAHAGDGHAGDGGSGVGAGYAGGGGDSAAHYHRFRSLGDSKNVSVVFSIGVLGGVSESMITKLNDAVTNGDFVASLSRNSGLNLILSGFFTLVYIVAENLRKIGKSRICMCLEGNHISLFCFLFLFLFLLICLTAFSFPLSSSFSSFYFSLLYPILLSTHVTQSLLHCIFL
jgi:hypothetical protein